MAHPQPHSSCSDADVKAVEAVGKCVQLVRKNCGAGGGKHSRAVWGGRPPEG